MIQQYPKFLLSGVTAATDNGDRAIAALNGGGGGGTMTGKTWATLVFALGALLLVVASSPRLFLTFCICAIAGGGGFRFRLGGDNGGLSGGRLGATAMVGALQSRQVQSFVFGFVFFCRFLTICCL